MKSATVFSPQLLRTGTPTAPGYIELTAEQAHAAAKKEGLTLQRSEKTASGFKGVSTVKGTRPYTASVSRNGDKVSLGTFATPEQAALEYARQPEVQAALAKLASAPAAEPSLSADEAFAAAKEEGLALLRSADSVTGFKGVSKLPKGARPFCARLYREGARVNLGFFATPEQAALVYARQPEVQAAATLASAPATEPSLSADEAFAAAEEEGLVLLKSSSSATGFEGVCKIGGSRARPFGAHLWLKGAQFHLGNFATAEEAALTLARRRRRAEERQPASGGVGEDDERDECPVCLDPLSSVVDVVKTTCGHDFCRACLFRHFDDDLNANCPSCRHKLIKGEEKTVDRPEAPRERKRRHAEWSVAEQDTMPSLVMRRARAADSSQAGPSSAQAKVYRFSANEIGQDAGRLPRRPRSCQRLGLPDWRPPPGPADPEQSA